MPSPCRPEERRASHAYVPGIHAFQQYIHKDVDGTCNSVLPELCKKVSTAGSGIIRPAVTSRAQRFQRALVILSGM
jgi:hypothetical protein